MLKIAVFVSGGGTDLQSVIDAIEANQITGKIVLVISNRKNAYGLERAKKAGIETAVVKKDDELIVKMLKEREVDLVVLAGYLAILSDVLIDAYPNKIINELVEPQEMPKLKMASILDIAIMKVVAIGGRGAKKDFFDLYNIINITLLDKIIILSVLCK